jgi:hypothetical protein
MSLRMVARYTAASQEQLAEREHWARRLRAEREQKSTKQPNYDVESTG